MAVNGCSLTAYSCAPDARYPLQQQALCSPPPPAPAWRHLQPKSRPPLRKEREKKRHWHRTRSKNPRRLADKTQRVWKLSRWSLSRFPLRFEEKREVYFVTPTELFARFNASCCCVKTRDLRSGVAARARKLNSQWIWPTEATVWGIKLYQTGFILPRRGLKCRNHGRNKLL